MTSLIGKLLPFGLLAVAVGGLMIVGKQNEQEQISSVANKTEISSVTTSESEIDFGSISMKKGVVSRVIKLTNTSAEPITVTDIRTSCMCTEATLSLDEITYGPFGMPGHSGGRTSLSATIPPSGEASLTVSFDPAAHGPAGIGAIERAVFVGTKTGVLSPIILHAVVQP